MFKQMLQKKFKQTQIQLIQKLQQLIRFNYEAASKY